MDLSPVRRLLPRRAPLVFSLLVGLVAVGILPWTMHAVRPDAFFFPTVVAVVGCFDLLSAYLLTQQFRAEGDPRLLAMAAAYSWSLVVMLGCAGAFVPLVSTHPPLASAPSVSPWMYICWHAGFPVLLGLTWLPWPARLARTLPVRRRWPLVWASQAAAVGSAAAVVALLVLRGPELPVVIHGQDLHRLTTLTGPVTVPLVVASALATTWALRRRTGPERWTAAAVWVSLTDLSLTYLSEHRFSVGWYVGRTLTVVASALVLVAIIRETGRVRVALAATLDRAHELERERFRREQMLRGIIANNHSLVYVKDLDGRYLLANEEFERTFDVTEGDLLGRDDTYLDPVLAPVWRLVDLRAQHEEVHAEEWINEPHGRNCYESVTFPLRDADGAVYAICGVSVDVTASRTAAAEMARVRDEALAAAAAKSAFLATMSHEIRTPMNAVIGLTDLLLDTSLDPDQRELVDIVRGSGNALLVIINDVLDFSRLESGEVQLEPRPFDVTDCVQDAVALVALAAEARGLDLVADIEQSCPRLVIGDGTRFRQVVVNLLGNAVKFTERGEVVVTVSAEEPPAGLGDEGAPLQLQVSVRDTGIGIPAERLHLLFQSFTQVDSSTTRVYGGSGLGLAISRRLARAMGGDIDVRSELGVGSTFTFTAMLTEHTERRAEPDPGTGYLAGSAVLVVDANGASRRALVGLLTRWDVRCTEADSAAAALALVAHGLQVDVALIDAQLPGETGAHEVARALRELPGGGELPLICLRRLSWGMAPAAPGLFVATLTKPVRTQALREKLLAVLAPTESAVLTVESAGGHRRRDAPVLADAPPLVLLAEDNAVNQRVAQLMLARLGYRVDTVSNGLEAVHAIRRKTYDLVLMDVQMPQLDGLRATEMIRAELPADGQPPIVGVTASVLAEDRAACVDAGMDGYLSKPIRATELATLMQDMLARVRR